MGVELAHELTKFCSPSLDEHFKLKKPITLYGKIKVDAFLRPKMSKNCIQEPNKIRNLTNFEVFSCKRPHQSIPRIKIPICMPKFAKKYTTLVTFGRFCLLPFYMTTRFYISRSVWKPCKISCAIVFLVPKNPNGVVLGSFPHIFTIGLEIRL